MFLSDPELSFSVVSLDHEFQIFAFSFVLLEERDAVAHLFELVELLLQNLVFDLELLQMRLFSLPERLLSGSVLHGSL
jgi:hypothetical protein